MSKLAAALLASLFAAAVTVDASAFCRSTTCDTRKTDCQRDDEGCKTTGQPLQWKTSCPGLSLAPQGTRNIDAADVDRVLAASMAAWSALPCVGGGTATFSWAKLAASSCAVGYRKTLPNANVIVFRDDAWPHQGAENTLGFTTVTFDVDSGEILDSDTEINTAQNPITVTDTAVKYDLQSILTHELGHALGLAHSGDPNATMYATYDQGTTSLRSLAPDDVDAVCAAYLPTRTAACGTAPANGFSTDCSETEPAADGGGCAFAGRSGAAAPAIVGAALLLGLLRGKRRRIHA